MERSLEKLAGGRFARVVSRLEKSADRDVAGGRSSSL